MNDVTRRILDYFCDHPDVLDEIRRRLEDPEAVILGEFADKTEENPEIE